MAADSDLDLNIDKTVGDFIDEVAPGAPDETPPEKIPVDPGTAEPAVTSLAKPAKPGGEPIAYPKSWKQDFTKYWPNVPRELQEYVTNTREREYLDGLEQYKAGHNAYGQIFEVLQPYMPRLTALQMPPHEAIRALMNADWVLSQGSPDQKVEMLRQICQTYGIDVAGLAKGTAEQPYRTDAEIALAKKFDGLAQNFQSFVGQHLAGQRAEIDKTVAAFAADPAHPHFNECGDHIVRLLSADKSLSLQDAYDQAVWANPSTRAKEIERVSKENAEKARKEREEAAKNAARARAANVRGTPSNKGTGTAKGSWEDELAPNLAKINQRT